MRDGAGLEHLSILVNASFGRCRSILQITFDCPDFLNKEARDYFADQYKLDVYKGSTLDTYTWNDMNEPSVFNGPEVTMAKDKMHGAVEHRDLHNMYGMLYTMATHQVQMISNKNLFFI